MIPNSKEKKLKLNKNGKAINTGIKTWQRDTREG